MYRATKDVILPTTTIGSLPRPTWYTEKLERRPFLEAMVNAHYREQYTDAVSAFIRDQETAGLDILTDGDARFDYDVGGHSWFSYPLTRLAGFETAHGYRPGRARANNPNPRGAILHEGMESRISPEIVGPVGRGDLQYTPLWKTAQKLTRRPVKFGTITAELVAMASRDSYYKDMRECMLAIADALNEELHELADAGCPIIQMEEPQIHLLGPRGIQDDDVLSPKFMVELFNRTVRGLRDKTEVWCHTCWGNPSQQRMFSVTPSYEPVLELFNDVDTDVVTFETCSSGGMDLEAIGRVVKDKKISIGVIDHHTLQVERPEEVADSIRAALKHIPAERLVLASDCGMGREGMARKHAFYKMVAIVRGANIVKKELGLPEADCLAADGAYSFVETI